MYNVFDEEVFKENGYAKFFGDDNKPMVNTIQGPSYDEAVSDAAAINCVIK